MILSLLAQATGTTPPAAAPPSGSGQVNLLKLFMDSADLFTVLLLIGSVIAVTVILRCLFEVRASRVIPSATEAALRRLTREGKVSELRGFAERDGTFLSAVLIAALSAPGDRAGRREAAELMASAQCALWFRKIEPLNVIGNLGPLLGLAGTVWGMIKAFVALSQAGGQANPALLSEGIGKALFHTLGGLLLAVPALAVFGFYRGIVDRLCTRAMVVSSELVESLPDDLGSPASRAVSGFTPVGAVKPPAAEAVTA
jgi:biopolymer transport protein ExbB